MTDSPHNNPQKQPAFPLAPAMIMLTLVMGLLGLAAHAWLPQVMDDFNNVAVNAALVLVWVTTVLSLVPVAILGPLGVMPTVWAYFAGMGLRMLLCLGAVAVLLFLVPAVPVYPFVVVMLATYIPTLFIEVAWVARYLWLKDALPPTPPLEMVT